jgi:hypothetical protein
MAKINMFVIQINVQEGTYPFDHRVPIHNHLLEINLKIINVIKDQIISKLDLIGLEVLPMGIALKNPNKMIIPRNMKLRRNWKLIPILFINMVIYSD